MAIQPPNEGLLKETGQQYYQGAQGFLSSANPPAVGNTQSFTTTFNTDLIFGSEDSTDTDYALNNFKIFTSPSGFPGTFTELDTAGDYSLNGNTFKISNLAANTYIVVQLKLLSGGNYGNTEADKAYGETVENNYGSYQYIKLQDIVNNFLVGYVGQNKLLPDAKRTEVVFHAKRGMQEFSYDTLKSIKSSELTIPDNLTLVLPQDYVNYVRMSWIDSFGVKRIIYPTNNLTISPFNTQVQDVQGIPTQDNFGNDIEGTSITEERWHSANDQLINGSWTMQDFTNDIWAYNWDYPGSFFGATRGQMYGMEPQYSQYNGWFNMNEREGKVSFSSNLKNKLIVLEYISDGLATDLDTKLPKLAEEAMYAHILYSIVASRINQPEYIVQRLKRDRSAKLRNTKIRLSNIKLDEIVQVMRGKSKWIKH